VIKQNRQRKKKKREGAEKPNAFSRNLERGKHEDAKWDARFAVDASKQRRHATAPATANATANVNANATAREVWKYAH
jgi:hypothetical protein